MGRIKFVPSQGKQALCSGQESLANGTICLLQTFFQSEEYAIERAQDPHQWWLWRRFFHSIDKFAKEVPTPGIQVGIYVQGLCLCRPLQYSGIPFRKSSRENSPREQREQHASPKGVGNPNRLGTQLHVAFRRIFDHGS